MHNADVDVFVGNNTIIDPEVYQLWLNGYSAPEAATILQKRGILQQYGATYDLLLGDIWDNYRNFSMLERLLQNPPRMDEQLTFQIHPDTQKLIIESYYEFDASVMREILGKKLSSRNRNSLDDVSEKTRVPLRACRRQFDNLKQVFKVVEDMMGSLVSNIRTHFLLSPNLAQQYAAIVFITNNRFETSKKKLSYLTFDDFVHCANQMITHWSYSSKDCRHHDDMDVDFDRDFLHSLRDLKPLSDWKQLEEHKALTITKVRGKLSTSASADLEGSSKVISGHTIRTGKTHHLHALGFFNIQGLCKNLINIGNQLNHSKDMRDLFIDCVEKVVEPCRQAGWTQHDIRLFLRAYTEAGHRMEIISRSTNMVRAWDRYMAVVSSCLVQIYHS